MFDSHLLKGAYWNYSPWAPDLTYMLCLGALTQALFPNSTELYK